MCDLHNIPTVKSVADIIPGWCERPKGVLQILYERGYIDKDLVKNPNSMRYSRKGREEDIDEDGQLIENGKRFSLDYLVDNCEDFVNELNDLEHLAQDIYRARRK